MPSAFRTDELLDAAQTLLKSGMSFTPKIVMKSDLMFWPEGTIAQLDAKVPAVLVKPLRVDPSPADVTAKSFRTDTTLRVVVVDKFSPPDEDVVQKRIDRAEDVADRFISGVDLDMAGATIAGFRWFQAVPVRIHFEPPEDDLVSFARDRNLFAVAVDVTVQGEADRL